MAFRRSSSSLLVALVFGIVCMGSYNTFLAPSAFVTPPTPPGQRVIRHAQTEGKIDSLPVSASTDAQTEDAVESGMNWGLVVFGVLFLFLGKELINNGSINCVKTSGPDPTCVLIPAGFMVWKWYYAINHLFPAATVVAKVVAVPAAVMAVPAATAVAVMTPEAPGIGAAVAALNATAGIAADATLSSTAATAADVAGIASSAQPLEAAAGIVAAAEPLQAVTEIAAAASP